MKNDDKSPFDGLIKSDNRFMIDADLLPLVEKAKNGCIDSQIELSVAFDEGKGAKKNHELANKFEFLMFHSTDDNNFKLAALWNPAMRDFQNGNYESMIERFENVTYFMLRNIPMEKWDFSLFQIMKEYTQLSDIKPSS